MSATAEEVWAILKEVALERKKTEQMFQETERKFQETERRFQETERQIKESSREVDKKIGKLGNRLGDFIEGMVRPAAVRLFQEKGIDVHEVYPAVNSKRGGEELEIDLLVCNDNDVIAIECKRNLGVDDVKEHLERLEKVKRLLPKYASSSLIGAVAGMVVQANAALSAYRQGLFVIGQTGNHWAIRNDEQFVPRFC